jgi:hypothetical protein
MSKTQNWEWEEPILTNVSRIIWSQTLNWKEHWLGTTSYLPLCDCSVVKRWLQEKLKSGGGFSFSGAGIVSKAFSKTKKEILWQVKTWVCPLTLYCENNGEFCNVLDTAYMCEQGVLFLLLRFLTVCQGSMTTRAEERAEEWGLILGIPIKMLNGMWLWMIWR